MRVRKDLNVFDGYDREPALHRLQWPMVLGDWPACPVAVLVGEAPGSEESMLGRPFVGRAGRRLDTLLPMTRDRFGITNVVKGRPTDLTGKRDRPPALGEVAASVPYLWRELDCMAAQHTRILCALGHTAIKALSGYDGPVGKVAGTWCQVTDPVGLKWMLFRTFHPAAAVRNEDMNAALGKHLAIFVKDVDQWGDRALVQLR